jgi:hypothetical protein
MHPSFIRGFVKQCYNSGLSESQAEAALNAWALREQLEDPDFRTGFDKRASTLDKLMQGWDSMGRTGQGAVVGGGAGALAGLLGGGKHKLRNALLGGGAGAVLGGTAGHYLGNRPAGAEVNDRAFHGDLLKKPTGVEMPNPRKEKDLADLKAQLDTGANSFKGEAGAAPFTGSAGKRDTALIQPVTTTDKQNLTPAPVRPGALRAFGGDPGNQKDLALAAMRKLQQQMGSTTNQGTLARAGGAIGNAAEGAVEGVGGLVNAGGRALKAPVNAAKAVGSEAKRVGTALSEGFDRARQQAKETETARELEKLRSGL